MEVVGGSKKLASGRSAPAANGSSVLQQGGNAASNPTPFEELRLTRVIGFGGSPGEGLVAYHRTSPGLLAAVAGTSIVLVDTASKAQLRHYRAKRGQACLPFACVAFGGKETAVVAGGERNSNHAPSSTVPAVHVWEASSGRHLASLRYHKAGIAGVAFGPGDGRLLASVGASYDGQLSVWDWAAGTQLARLSAQTELHSVSFTEDGGSLVTVGKDHLKVWSMSGGPFAARGKSTPLILAPKPVAIKDFRGSVFVDVKAAPSSSTLSAPGGTAGAAAGAGNGVYALTSGGHLLMLRGSTRAVDKSVNLQVHAAYGLAVSSSLVACACSAGVVRMFATRTLQFKCNLPRPSPTLAAAQRTGAYGSPAGPLGSGSPGGMSGGPPPGSSDVFPDALALAFDVGGEQLAVSYADRSLILWDVRNLSKITRVRSFLSHSAAIWDAALLPVRTAALMGLTGAGPEGSQGGAGTTTSSSALVTCSADGTLRLWSLGADTSSAPPSSASKGVPTQNYARNARTLRGVLRVGADDAHLLEVQAEHSTISAGSTPGAAVGSRQLCSPEVLLPMPGHGNGGFPGQPAVQLRCLRISRDGLHLATGDAAGNVRVYNLLTLSLVAVQEAHDSEVLSLDYSPGFLVSGGRDAMVHVFDIANDYMLVNTLEEHTGAVTAVRFSPCGMRLASGGADRTLVFRDVVDTRDCSVTVRTCVQLPALPATSAPPVSARMPGPVAAGSGGLGPAIGSTPSGGRGVVYDIAIDASGSRAVVAAQGGWLRVYDMATGAQLTAIAQAPGTGEAVRVSLDPTGTYAVCACSGGAITVMSLEPPASGHTSSKPPAGPGKAAPSSSSQEASCLVARASGHGELATAAVLLHDGNSLVSVGGDSCILQWALPASLAAKLQAAAAQQGHKPVPTQQQQVQQQHKPAPDIKVLVEEHGVVCEASTTPRAVKKENAWSNKDSNKEHKGLVSSTLLRIKHGMPLLSTDKLPRWAAQRAPPGAPDPAPAQPNTPGGASGIASPAAPQGKWAAAKAIPALAPASRLGAAVGAKGAPAGSAAASALAGGPAQQQATTSSPTSLPSPRPWADDLEEADDIVMFDAVEEDQGRQAGAFSVEERGSGDAADDAQGEDLSVVDEGLDDESLAAAPICPLSGVGSNQPSRKGAAGGGLQRVSSEELPRGAQDVACSAVGKAPAAMANGAGKHHDVKKDLFRQHFDNLDQVSGTTTPAAPAGQQALPDARRHSLTAVYRQLAKSLLAAGPAGEALVTAVVEEQGDAAGVAGAPKLATHVAMPQVTAGTPGTALGLWAAKEAGNQKPVNPALLNNTGDAEITSAFKPGKAAYAAAGVALPASVDAPQQGDTANQPLVVAAHGRQRRAGQMEHELAKMRERLCSLQKAFAAQQAKHTPWKNAQQHREEHQQNEEAQQQQQQPQEQTQTQSKQVGDPQQASQAPAGSTGAAPALPAREITDTLALISTRGGKSPHGITEAFTTRSPQAPGVLPDQAQTQSEVSFAPAAAASPSLGAGLMQTPGPTPVQAQRAQVSTPPTLTPPEPLQRYMPAAAHGDGAAAKVLGAAGVQGSPALGSSPAVMCSNDMYGQEEGAPTPVLQLQPAPVAAAAPAPAPSSDSSQVVQQVQQKQPAGAVKPLALPPFRLPLKAVASSSGGVDSPALTGASAVKLELPIKSPVGSARRGKLALPAFRASPGNNKSQGQVQLQGSGRYSGLGDLTAAMAAVAIEEAAAPASHQDKPAAPHSVSAPEVLLNVNPLPSAAPAASAQVSATAPVVLATTGPQNTCGSLTVAALGSSTDVGTSGQSPEPSTQPPANVVQQQSITAPGGEGVVQDHCDIHLRFSTTSSAMGLPMPPLANQAAHEAISSQQGAAQLSRQEKPQKLQPSHNGSSTSAGRETQPALSCQAAVDTLSSALSTLEQQVQNHSTPMLGSSQADHQALVLQLLGLRARMDALLNALAPAAADIKAPLRSARSRSEAGVTQHAYSIHSAPAQGGGASASDVLAASLATLGPAPLATSLPSTSKAGHTRQGSLLDGGGVPGAVDLEALTEAVARKLMANMLAQPSS